MARPRRGVTDADRILSKVTVDDETGCWEWQGYRQPAGHGRTRFGGRKVLVHRWVFEHLVGPIPDGLSLDHLCRNPPCCNPDHLDAVDHRTNVLRGVGPAAINARKTQCPKGHPYDEANTHIDGLGRRVCRTCRKAWTRKSNQRRRAARRLCTGCDVVEPWSHHCLGPRVCACPRCQPSTSTDPGATSVAQPVAAADQA